MDLIAVNLHMGRFQFENIKRQQCLGNRFTRTLKKNQNKRKQNWIKQKKMTKLSEGPNIFLWAANQEMCAEGPARAQAPSLPEFDMLGRSL